MNEFDLSHFNPDEYPNPPESVEAAAGLFEELFVALWFGLLPVGVFLFLVSMFAFSLAQYLGWVP